MAASLFWKGVYVMKKCMGVMGVFFAFLLVGCQGHRGDDEQKKEAPFVVFERTDAPVHDVRTVAKLFHLDYTEAELAAFGQPPAPRPGYVTFFDPGWKAFKFRYFPHHALFLELKSPEQYPHLGLMWAGKTAYKLEEKPQYRQLRMGPVKHSLGKIFQEQCVLLSPDEEIPPLRQVVAAFVIHSALTGEDLFSPWCILRCADRVHFAGDTEPRGHAVVMTFPRPPQNTPSLWTEVVRDEESSDRWGLASARRLP